MGVCLSGQRNSKALCTGGKGESDRCGWGLRAGCIRKGLGGHWRGMQDLEQKEMIQSDSCFSRIILASVLRLKEEQGGSRLGRAVTEASVNSGRR